MEKINVIINFIRTLYNKFGCLIQNKIPFGQKVFFIIDIILKILFILITVWILEKSIWGLIYLILQDLSLLINLLFNNYLGDFDSYSYFLYTYYLDNYLKYLDSALIFIIYIRLFSRTKLSFIPFFITILYFYMNKDYLHLDKGSEILLYSFSLSVFYVLIYKLIIYCYNNTKIKSYFNLLINNIKIFLKQNPFINFVLDVFYKYIITIICSFSFLIPISLFGVLIYDSIAKYIPWDVKFIIEFFAIISFYLFYLLITSIIYIFLFSQNKLSIHPSIINFLIFSSFINGIYNKKENLIMIIIFLFLILTSGVIINFFHNIYITKLLKSKIGRS